MPASLRRALGHWRARWTLVFAVYGVSVWFTHYGLHTHAHGADVGVYADDARRIAGGALPYRTVYFEYPPGALAPLLAVERFADYAYAFKVLMAILGGAMLLVCGDVLSSLRRRPLRPLLLIAVSPLAVGSVFLNRYDVWPALLTVAAVALLLRARNTAGSAANALAMISKIFPAAAFPPAIAWIARRSSTGASRRALLAWLGIALVVVLPFAVLGPGGLRFSFTIQATRHLESESLGGSILLAADRLGLYHATIHTGNPGSLDVFGTVPDILAALALIVVIAVVAWITWRVARSTATSDQLVVATAAAITAYVAFGKVLSPQYLVWLVPLVPLVRGRLPSVLFLAAIVLTQIEFDHDYSQLHTVGRAVWILLARNLVLVALAIVLLAEVALRRRPDVDAVHEHMAIAGAT